MATSILSVTAKAVTHTPQYHLPEADRQAILAQADHPCIDREIERQLKQFAARNFGCEFGQNIQPKHLK